MEGMDNEILQAANNALAAEVARLRAERDEARGDRNRLESIMADKRVEVVSALAEVERLREKVYKLRNALVMKMDEYKAHDPGCCEACDKARSALLGEED